MRCVVCRKPIVPKAQNPSFPFCSERCKLVDLGKWLGEEYRVASRNQDAEDDGVPQPDTAGSDEGHH